MNETQFWTVIGGLVFWTLFIGIFSWRMGIQEERGREREKPADITNTSHPRWKAGFAGGWLAAKQEFEKKWVVQDSRQVVGNAVLWWGSAGGYTTDISKAHRFTKEEADAIHKNRVTDIPWPVAYIDELHEPNVLATSLDRQLAKIVEEERPS